MQPRSSFPRQQGWDKSNSSQQMNTATWWNSLACSVTLPVFLAQIGQRDLMSICMQFMKNVVLLCHTYICLYLHRLDR